MKHQLISTQALLKADRQEMYTLLGTYFDGVTQDVFLADLAQKNWVLLLRDATSGQLQGFSTLLLYTTEFEGEAIHVIYSGDTIVAPSAWSSSNLSRAWINSVKQLQSDFNHGKFYWLLISSGYRTYRFLPVFWREFYPRYDMLTPDKIKALMDVIARERFGRYYDAQAGIVRFPHPQSLRDLPPPRKNNPHVRFFTQQNPGYIRGDELVCLTEICEHNLTQAGRRMWFGNSVNTLI